MAQQFEVSSNYIPDDISFYILSKLSVKSIKRFSCVRKSWNHLFENPNFMNMFRDNLVSKSRSLCDENDVCLVLNQFAASEFHLDMYLVSGDSYQNKVKLDFPSLFPNAHNGGGALVCILGSAINGILCIHDYNEDANVVLWNPATEEIKVIPPNFPEVPDEVLVDFTLHGFGYDYVRDDYKVIRHGGYTTLNKPLVDYDDEIWEIYSLKSNSWRKLGFDMPMRYVSANDEGYFNGMCHWLGETSGETYVVSFNLADEVFFLTPLPVKYMPTHFNVRLMVLNESFTMISNHKETKCFQISILGEFGVKESWVRLFDVGPLSFIIQRPIGAGKKNDIFFRTIDNELVYFNLTTGMIEKIDIKEEIWWCKMMIYKKNLHPIGGINN